MNTEEAAETRRDRDTVQQGMDDTLNEVNFAPTSRSSSSKDVDAAVDDELRLDVVACTSHAVTSQHTRRQTFNAAGFAVVIATNESRDPALNREVVQRLFSFFHSVEEARTAAQTFLNRRPVRQSMSATVPVTSNAMMGQKGQRRWVTRRLTGCHLLR